MKKFIALLLTLIMVFTLLPSAALADDPPPTPTPEPTESPIYTKSFGNVDGKNIVVKIFPSYVKTYADNECIETVPIGDYSGNLGGAFPNFNGQNGIEQMTNYSGLKDPERANYTLVPSGGSDSNGWPIGTKYPLPAADPSLGLGGGYYELGKIEYTNSSVTLPVTVYRKMSSSIGFYQEFPAGTTIGVIFASISFATGIGEVATALEAFLALVDLAFIVKDTAEVIEVVISDDVEYNSLDYWYDYALIEPEGEIHRANRTVSYISSFIFDGTDDGYNVTDKIYDSFINCEGILYNDIGEVASNILSDYMVYGNHTCLYDDCETDVYCNICFNYRIPGHDFSWTELLIPNSEPNPPYLGWGHEKYCKVCGYTEQRGLHEYTNCEDTTCNVCGKTRTAPGHIYTNPCTDTECARCHATRSAPGHDFSWIGVEIWGGSPYIFMGYGHEQYCQVCGYVQNRELHHTQYWSNDTQTPYEIGFCEDCGAQMQQAHSFYSYWSDPDLAYICAHGGMLVTECEHNCGYVNFEDVPAGHIYSNDCDEICDRCLQTTRTVPHSYANCVATTCSLCGYVRSTVPGHFYVHMPWVIEGTEDICKKQLVSCSNCSDSYWINDDSHTWADCEDAYCDDCGFHRTSPGHAMSTPLWESVGETGVCRVFKNHCTREGCNYTQIVSTDTSHSYDPECTDTTCTDCSYVRPTVPGHSYLNCVDTTCEICNAPRTAPGHFYVTMPWVTVGTSGTCKKQLVACSNCSDEYWVYDTSHTWSDDCTDEYCNDCGYHRAVPGHAMSTPLWVAVKTSSTCRVFTNYCTRSGCSYTQIVSTDTSHSYSPECTDTTCSDCGYVRTAPGHSYTYSWVHVCTLGTCQKRVGTCSVCGDSYVSSYDYSHSYNSWTSISSSQHRHACTTCGYIQDGNHSYPSSWSYYSSTKHKHACTGCGYTVYQSHTWTYVGGGVYRCSVCGGNKVG